MRLLKILERGLAVQNLMMKLINLESASKQELERLLKKYEKSQQRYKFPWRAERIETIKSLLEMRQADPKFD